MLNIMKRFFNFCGKENKQKFYKSLVYGVFLAVFEALKIPAVAVMLKALIANNITNTSIFLSFGIMLISILGHGIVKYRSTILQTEAGYTVCANKRIEIAEHLRYLPMGYFNKNSLGYITSVTTNTMESLSDVATRVVMSVSSGILTTALITLMLFFYDIRIASIIIIGLCIYACVNSNLQRKAGALSGEKSRSDSALVEKVLEYIQGITEVKSYWLLGKFSKNLNTAIDDNCKINTQMELHMVPLMMLQNFVAKLIGVAICVFSILFFYRGTMELLSCMMMIISSFLITGAIESAGNHSALLRVVYVSMEKAKEILDLPPMDISGIEQKPNSYDIEAKDIEFSYGKKKIINGISVKISEGTTTAIVGPSGSGKTTFCNLLSRFWDVDAGQITLSGMNIKEYSMNSLMQNFSFVFQNVTLFSDTVANNIRFGQPNANMDEVIKAAKKARCHEFIMKLPNGYNTVIDENGGSLSGGERQRLSIARAMMKDAPIIILDEATANVDPENEKDLMEAIDELTKDKTIIMIAHRLKTIQNADQILVIDKGRIVQQGKHNDLMEQEGIYKRFIDSRKQAVGWKV